MNSMNHVENDAYSSFASSRASENQSSNVVLSEEELQARLSRNALSLSDDNQQCWSGVISQDWFEPIRMLARQSQPLQEWIYAVERVAAGGGASAADVKQAVFYRTAFRNASLSSKDMVIKDSINSSLITLSRYVTQRLKPQHNHFG